MPESSTVTELRASTLQTPELDAEAPGPHILEFESVERVLEMGSQRQITELDGRSRYVAEL